MKSWMWWGAAYVALGAAVCIVWNEGATHAQAKYCEQVHNGVPVRLGLLGGIACLKKDAALKVYE